MCVYIFVQVIYVKPGHQADLDSLIRDTIRLTTTVKVLNTHTYACTQIYILLTNNASYPNI